MGRRLKAGKTLAKFNHVRSHAHSETCFADNRSIAKTLWSVFLENGDGFVMVQLSTTQPLYTPQNYIVSSFALRRTPHTKHDTQTNKQTLPPLPAHPLATHVKENKTISVITRNLRKEIQFGFFKWYGLMEMKQRSILMNGRDG